MAKVIRAVVEVGVPDSITEKRLVQKLREILRYPIQLGHTGDRDTLRRAEVKSYSRVRAAGVRASWSRSQAPRAGDVAFSSGWDVSANPHDPATVDAMRWTSDWWRANADAFEDHVHGHEEDPSA